MIDLYTADTPNGRKIVFMLEELAIPYTRHDVNLKANEQKSPQFLALNPNGRIPVIVDQKGPYDMKTTIFESGAILYYLAEKYNSLLGHSLADKARVMQWVMFQMSGQAPIFGNYHYGMHTLKPFNPAYVQRFEKEALRVLDVLNTQLRRHDYLAGAFFSIADIALYPWIASFLESKPEWFERTPSLRRWAATIAKRPAAQKAMQ